MQSSLAFDEIPRGTGGAGATEAINQVLHDAGPTRRRACTTRR